MAELKETLPEAGDGVLTLWLTEAGSDKKAREMDAAILKGSDFQFRNLRRIIRDLFNKELEKEYKDREESQFSLGYKAALRDLYKIIPQTKSD